MHCWVARWPLILPPVRSPKSPLRQRLELDAPPATMLMLLMRGWHAPSPARASSLQASSSSNVGESGAACHILAHGDATTWLCDDGSCVETQHTVLCTEPHDAMHCVLQEGLSIDGKPVWACAPVNLEGGESSRESSRGAPQRSSSQLHMSLVRRKGA